jgi:hypothetical protein
LGINYKIEELEIGGKEPNKIRSEVEAICSSCEAEGDQSPSS